MRSITFFALLIFSLGVHATEAVRIPTQFCRSFLPQAYVLAAAQEMGAPKERAWEILEARLDKQQAPEINKSWFLHMVNVIYQKPGTLEERMEAFINDCVSEAT